MKRITAKKCELGLSLLELIIALVLVGMIAAVSYPSLSLIIKSWSRIEFATTPSDDFAVERFVRQSIEQAMLVFSREKSTRENLLVFDGRSSYLSFVRPIDYFASVPGLYLATFKIEERNSLQILTFSYALYREAINLEEGSGLGKGPEIGMGQGEQRVIIENISGAELKYYSSIKKAWLPDWEDEKTLPSLISLSFVDNKDIQQRWVMSPRMARPVFRYAAGFEIGT